MRADCTWLISCEIILETWRTLQRLEVHIHALRLGLGGLFFIPGRRMLAVCVEMCIAVVYVTYEIQQPFSNIPGLWGNPALTRLSACFALTWKAMANDWCSGGCNFQKEIEITSFCNRDRGKVGSHTQGWSVKIPSVIPGFCTDWSHFALKN